MYQRPDAHHIANGYPIPNVVCVFSGGRLCHRRGVLSPQNPSAFPRVWWTDAWNFTIKQSVQHSDTTKRQSIKPMVYPKNAFPNFFLPVIVNGHDLLLELRHDINLFKHIRFIVDAPLMIKDFFFLKFSHPNVIPRLSMRLKRNCCAITKFIRLCGYHIKPVHFGARKNGLNMLYDKSVFRDKYQNLKTFLRFSSYFYRRS